MTYVLAAVGLVVVIGGLYWLVKGRKKYDVNVGER